ncbi:hypothetical protein HYX12_01430 [Candidatus Woesearchaeota archaeon]|nr:hypothetical protein [Candidatus Woesearchaeota archaeon]
MDESDLRKEFQQKKREVSHLRNKLNSLHQEKEALFKQMRSSFDAIKSHNSRMTALKQERDKFTQEIKELKGQRDAYNQEVKMKSTALKEVEKKKENLVEGMESQESPGRIKAMIAQLETKIETEVMPFSKELQLTKTIKELKARYKQVQGLQDVWKERNTAAADFSQKRKEAQSVHYTIQEKAEESQKRHEELNSLYDEIKKLRAEIKPLEDKRKQIKADYEKTKKELEDILARVKELAKILDEREEADFQTIARERTAEVKEKLKSKKKLTTEDILAFQALKE